MVAAPPVVIGLDFGGTKIAAAVCDLAGNQLASTTVDSGGALGAQASFGRGIGVCRDLLSLTAPDSQLVAVGVSTFGIPFEDRVELAPAIDGWDRLAMGRELRAAFAGAQIRMTNDAKAAAHAEVRWGLLAGCDPAVYLNLGTGLAAAIVVGGQVVNGVNGAAGEIGYNLRSVTDVGLALDQRSLLEHMVSGQGLAERAAGPERHGKQLTAADVFAAGAADSELDTLIDDFVDELAYHLVNLAILVNPARIAVGGGIVRSWTRIRPPLQRALHSGTPFPPELVVAHFPYDAPLLGAIAMAVDAAQGWAEPDQAVSTSEDAAFQPGRDRHPDVLQLAEHRAGGSVRQQLRVQPAEGDLHPGARGLQEGLGRHLRHAVGPAAVLQRRQQRRVLRLGGRDADHPDEPQGRRDRD